MTWEYRLLRYADGTLGLHEVYYRKGEKRPTSCTRDAVGAIGDDAADVAEVLRQMSGAFAKPPIAYDTFSRAELRNRVHVEGQDQDRTFVRCPCGTVSARVTDRIPDEWLCPFCGWPLAWRSPDPERGVGVHFASTYVHLPGRKTKRKARGGGR